jgi:phosphate butyryltransferase
VIQLSETILNFGQMIEVCRESAPVTVAVSGAEPNVISAMRESADFVDAVFIGNGAEIEKAVEEQQIDMAASGFSIRDVSGDDKDIAQATIDLVRDGEADMLMKGTTSTGVLMKAILDRDTGLRPPGDGVLLSHVAVMEVPTYHKLVFGSDGGIVPHPTLEQKVSILKNALVAVRAFRIKNPRVAPLTAVEKVSEVMPETVHADELRKMGEKGAFGDAIVAGPTAADVAVSKEAAEIKGIDSPVAGDVDVLLFPDITTGNAMIKSLMRLAHAKVGGIVMGATVPIILLSRADSKEDRLHSIVYSKAIAQGMN